MEKIVNKISTLITLLLIYVISAYSYLSSKGFVWTGDTFSLVSPASAAVSAPKAFAEALDPNINFDFQAPTLLGSENAPLTLYEFSSLGCTHCSEFHLNILPKLEKDFIKTGDLKVVFINFPLEKKSMQGAMLFNCIPVSYRHNFLNLAFTNQRDWMLSYNSDKILSGFALSSGLNAEKAQACLKNDALAQEIISKRQEAIDRLKIQGTPAFVIGGDGENEIIYGVPAYEELTAYLNNRLGR